MAVVRCKEGFHLYDNQKQSSCPYCRNAGRAPVRDVTTPGPQIPTKPPVSPGGGALTQPAGQRKPGSEPGMTMPVWPVPPGKKAAQVDPVVGWLVCTKGANFGRDYRLRAGLNRIGRGASMDVSISGDEKLSRENQASIVYDPVNNLYFLVHRDGQNLTYVNGVPALSQIQLKAGDRIQFGDTKLLFVPLCDDDFTWEL